MAATRTVAIRSRIRSLIELTSLHRHLQSPADGHRMNEADGPVHRASRHGSETWDRIAVAVNPWGPSALLHEPAARETAVGDHPVRLTHRG